LTAVSEARPEQSRAERPSALSLLPRLATFLYHLAREPRVPWTVKAAVVGMAVYLASPIDLIPDWIPGAGYLDDILLVGIVINYIFAKIPEEVLIEHWGEDIELLRRLQPARRKRKTG
jgi:uncharacterized membrane protein YkvA (DUF1232 family)